MPQTLDGLGESVERVGTDGAAITVARVLIDSPLPQLDRLFDYRVPESLLADVTVGVRVKVPLRSAGR